MTDAELILKYFRGRAEFVAVADDGSTFRPVPLESPLTSEMLTTGHLAGERCLGFYVMQADDKVCVSCVDFDNHQDKPNPLWRDQAEQLYYKLANLGLGPLVEISASGNGAHVWLFFSEPTDAWLVRAWWRAVEKHLDAKFVEVYPRQDRLTGKGMGNLIRYPLWSQSHFVDVENEWVRVAPANALGSVKLNSGVDLKVLCFEIGCGELKPEAPLIDTKGGVSVSPRVQQRLSRSYSLLARRWEGELTGLQDESRSALVLSIACELVRTYVPTPEIEQAIRHWCTEHRYDKGERDTWISGTIAKAYDMVLARREAKSVDSTTLDQACQAYLDMIQTGAPRFVASGVRELDASIDGLGLGQMAVIAARPSHGKSAFALHWLDGAAKAGNPCLIISEEMSALELAQRALLSISAMEEDQWTAECSLVRAEAKDHYADRAPIHIQENCNTIDRCDEVIDQFASIHGVKVVAVDYLQLLGGRDNSRYEIVTEISRKLKQAARRNNVALLALSQLNRGIDTRENHTPKLSDLRESGQIEQDADLILFLEWPLRYFSDVDPKAYRIFVAKRRNGPIRQQIVETEFDAEHQRFGKQSVATAYDEWNR